MHRTNLTIAPNPAPLDFSHIKAPYTVPTMVTAPTPFPVPTALFATFTCCENPARRSPSRKAGCKGPQPFRRRAAVAALPFGHYASGMRKLAKGANNRAPSTTRKAHEP